MPSVGFVIVDHCDNLQIELLPVTLGPVASNRVVMNSSVNEISALENGGAEPLADEEVFVFPATPAQRRFWLLDQLVPGGNPALNVPLAVQLRGTLDRTALEAAFAAIIDRHEILRTTFQYEKGQLCQVIAPALPFRVPVVDVRDYPASERTHVPAHLVAEESGRPFDLAAGPVCRARLIQLHPGEHTLLFTLHHIVTDGWSNGLLLRELTTLYAAFSQGQSSPLPELPIQFADYSEWQNDRVAGSDSRMQYWRETLAGALPVLDLPAEYSRVATRGRPATARTQWRTLPRELAVSLKTLAAREGVSGYMLSLAAFMILLARYDANGGEDVVVTTPAANRERAEVENLVGLFVNPLVLRGNLAGNPTFHELLVRVRKTVLGAFEHADVSFDRIVEELHPRRLQVNFLYQSAFLQPVRLPALEFLPLDSVSGGALFEWGAGVIEDESGLRICIEYNADLFADDLIARVLEDYEALLANVAAPRGTDLAINALPLASAPMALTKLRRTKWQVSKDGSAEWLSEYTVSGAESDVALTKPGLSLHVTDSRGVTCPLGVPGEIRVFGAELPEAGLATGDLGVATAHDEIRWLGRISQAIARGGLRIEPTQVEQALRAHPHVLEALVRPMVNSPQTLAAWIRTDGAPAALVSPDELRAFLREKLPEDWIPAAFVPVARFPATAEGWLDESKLPAPSEAATRDRSKQNYEAPYLTIHHQLIDLWQELLGVSKIGIRDDFFELGGNSLIALRMLYRVEQLCGKKLLPTTLFRQATIEGLADAILRNETAAGPSPDIVAIQEKGTRTPIFYFHGDLTGGGYYCMKLSRALGSDQPFYALPPLDVSDFRELPAIEEMAAQHIETIRAARPHGPYVVGGFCLGGLVAHAVARQLETAGERVERLLIIDATARNIRLKRLRRWAEKLGRMRHWDAPRKLYHFCRWHFLLARLKLWRGRDLRHRIGVVRAKIMTLLQRLLPAKAPAPAVVHDGGFAPRDARGSVDDGSWFDPRWDVPLVFLWATAGYQVTRFDGPTTLLLSHDLTGPEAEEQVAQEWAKYLPQMETRELAGSHLGCITEYADGLAETIRRTLAGEEPELSAA